MTRLRKVYPTPELVRIRPELGGRVGWDLGQRGPEGTTVEWEGIDRLYRVPEEMLHAQADAERSAPR